MIKILLINKIPIANNFEQSHAESIYDLIYPIINNSNCVFEHFNSNLSIFNNNQNMQMQNLFESIQNKLFDIVFVDPNSIDNNVIKNLRSHFPKLKLVLICHECFGHYSEYESVFPYADYIILHEISFLKLGQHYKKKIYSIHTITNKKSIFFLDTPLKKEIDFYFSGTISNERFDLLKNLKQNLKCNFVIGGGRYGQKTSNIENLECLKKSKSTLLFPFQKTRSFGKHILNIFNFRSSWNGRASFALGFEVLILSQRCRELEFFLSNNKDYISYINSTDLLDKIHYFSKNEEERIGIVKSAKKKFLELTSEKNFLAMCEKIVNGEKFYHSVGKTNIFFYNILFIFFNYKSFYIQKIIDRYYLFFSKVYKRLAILYNGQFK